MLGKRRRQVVLFVWDAKSSDPKRRTFYAELSGYGGYGGVLKRIPADDFEWVSGSAILVDKRYAEELRSLFSRYKDLVKWSEFVVRVY